MGVIATLHSFSIKTAVCIQASGVTASNNAQEHLTKRAESRLTCLQPQSTSTNFSYFRMRAERFVPLRGSNERSGEVHDPRSVDISHLTLAHQLATVSSKFRVKVRPTNGQSDLV